MTVAELAGNAEHAHQIAAELSGRFEQFRADCEGRDE